MRTRINFFIFIVMCPFLFIDCTPRYSSAWPWSAEKPHESVEQGLQQAKTLDDWRQRLRVDEARLTEYETTLIQRGQQIRDYLETEQGRQAKNRAALEQELETLAEKQEDLKQQWQVYNQNAAAVKQQEQKLASREHLFQASQHAAVQETVRDLQKQQITQNHPKTMTGVSRDAIVHVEPKLIGTLPNGDIGLTGGDVQVFVIEHVEPTPQPTTIPEQDARMQFSIQGIDDIEIKAKLPKILDDNNLTAVQNSLETGGNIAIQRFQIENTRLDNEKEISQLQEYADIIWWSMFFSPFLLFTIVKSFIAYRRADFILYEKRIRLETGILNHEKDSFSH